MKSYIEQELSTANEDLTMVHKEVQKYYNIFKHYKLFLI